MWGAQQQPATIRGCDQRISPRGFEMSLFEWCQWLQHTRFATAISESDWLFPLIEGSHILALPLSVGMIVILDLRLLGIAFCDGPGAKLVLNVMRWSKLGFAVMF